MALVHKQNDTVPVASAFTPSNGSNATAQAIWDFSSTSCAIWVYVPTINASATIAYGFFNSSGREKLIVLNQNPVSGWIFLANGTGSTNRVQLANNNGQTGTLIGVGSNTTSLKIVC